jgi:hypothetical protein
VGGGGTTGAVIRLGPGTRGGYGWGTTSRWAGSHIFLVSFVLVVAGVVVVVVDV